MWSEKFTERAEIKGYHVLLTGAKKIMVDDAKKTKEKEIATLKLLRLTSYNELILAQEDSVFFQIIEESKKKANKYGDARLAWTKHSRKFEPTTGDSNTGLCKKFTKCKLDDVTRNPEEWITELELIRGDLQKT